MYMILVLCLPHSVTPKQVLLTNTGNEHYDRVHKSIQLCWNINVTYLILVLMHGIPCKSSLFNYHFACTCLHKYVQWHIILYVTMQRNFF